MSIYDMKNGDKATFSCVDSPRLQEMGLISGRQFTVVRSGNPCIIDLNGSRIGVGRTEVDVL